MFLHFTLCLFLCWNELKCGTLFTKIISILLYPKNLLTLLLFNRLNLKLTFYSLCFYLGFKICQSYIILWRLSWWTKHVSFINYDWTQSLFFAIIQKLMEKSYLLFVEGTSFMLTAKTQQSDVIVPILYSLASLARLIFSILLSAKSEGLMLICFFTNGGTRTQRSPGLPLHFSIT